MIEAQKLLPFFRDNQLDEDTHSGTSKAQTAEFCHCEAMPLATYPVASQVFSLRRHNAIATLAKRIQRSECKTLLNTKCVAEVKRKGLELK